ncbi:A/G-specific adenine glycosylase [Mesonia sp. K7]|uniref:A/G-specific adenine glycosylase n=1 Tax=Mesonia sp. K7 TaxID=2218606 RepID=UPI000DA7C4C0|nr:A/G-specific adenine glycosylase [Mesonia sp. K7]PZD78959.1 A/G-specific adenine glycosylase [Mesonia sp. K7]
MKFSQQIIFWYRENARDLPWRKTKEPYNIWLSEIMLQQTRVAQGLPYYKKFIKNFPTVFELAQAKEDKVLKLWQGLGYYSRARNLHFTAKQIAENGGRFPDNYLDLKKLKGVGDYTASAIASFCYGEPVAVVDGNVYRVLSRYFGIDIPINSTEGIKIFKQKAEGQLDKAQPAIYNQAIMEFGARQCTPKNPDCQVCPLVKDCKAFQLDKITELPVKLKKTKVLEKHFNFLIFKNQHEEVLLEKREQKGIWRNLFQFPLYESEQQIFHESDIKEYMRQQNPKLLVKSIELQHEKPIKHVLSHRKLWVNFWKIEVDDFKGFSQKFIPVKYKRVNDFAVPIVIHKFLETYNFYS